MNKLIEKPHQIFSLAIPIILLAGFANRHTELSFNIHDTYFIIGYFHFTLLISVIFGILGFGYWVLQKMKLKLSKWLIWIHIGLTFGGTISILILTRLYKTKIMEYEFNNQLSLMIAMIILLIMVVQLIFPIHIIYGLIRKIKG